MKFCGEEIVSEINCYVGKMIRKYRKAAHMTLQDLADAVHKSRATVCKYENGEISLDIETLYEISQILQVSTAQLMNFTESKRDAEKGQTLAYERKSPFFEAKQLYFYFYDGRYNRMKDGIIYIHEKKEEAETYAASFSVCSVSGNGRSSESHYTGNVRYSDMLIRFSFVNTCNPLEEDLLYIFNTLEIRTCTDGLLCGISSADLMPCAFRCLVSLEPQELTEEFRQRLLFTKKELQRWRKLNMLLIDNKGDA